MSKTIFLDIDGTILEHKGVGYRQAFHANLAPLPGIYQKFEQWEKEGAKIILTTGRRESVRYHTERQLAVAGITYDLLIMGLGRGPRIVINDTKSNSDEPTAFAYTVKRNAGLNGINL